MLLTEFDANRQAIINPQDLHEPLEGFPKVARLLLFKSNLCYACLRMFAHEVICENVHG